MNVWGFFLCVCYYFYYVLTVSDQTELDVSSREEKFSKFLNQNFIYTVIKERISILIKRKCISKY